MGVSPQRSASSSSSYAGVGSWECHRSAVQAVAMQALGHGSATATYDSRRFLPRIALASQVVDLPAANFDAFDVGALVAALSVFALFSLDSLLSFAAFDPRRSHDINGLVLLFLVDGAVVAMVNEQGDVVAVCVALVQRQVIDLCSDDTECDGRDVRSGRSEAAVAAVAVSLVACHSRNNAGLGAERAHAQARHKHRRHCPTDGLSAAAQMECCRLISRAKLACCAAHVGARARRLGGSNRAGEPLLKNGTQATRSNPPMLCHRE
jgi:hypothetical protein